MSYSPKITLPEFTGIWILEHPISYLPPFSCGFPISNIGILLLIFVIVIITIIYCSYPITKIKTTIGCGGRIISSPFPLYCAAKPEEVAELERWKRSYSLLTPNQLNNPLFINWAAQSSTIGATEENKSFYSVSWKAPICIILQSTKWQLKKYFETDKHAKVRILAKYGFTLSSGNQIKNIHVRDPVKADYRVKSAIEELNRRYPMNIRLPEK